MYKSCINLREINTVLSTVNKVYINIYMHIYLGLKGGREGGRGYGKEVKGERGLEGGGRGESKGGGGEEVFLHTRKSHVPHVRLSRTLCVSATSGSLAGRQSLWG